MLNKKQIDNKRKQLLKMKIKNSLIDMMIRLKNSSQSYKKEVIITKTKQNIKLLNFLYQEGYIGGYSYSKKDITHVIVILKYQNYKPLIKNISFISKINKEVFCSVKMLSKQNDNNILYILLTTQGYMSISQAILKNLGGQLILKMF